jgi:uncharacterized protein YggU (UPF0235/DUF167 family)
MVRVTPNARDTSIDGAQTRDDGTPVLSLKVTEVPDKGRANKAVIALLAKNLSVPKSTIAVTRGATARLKTLTITGKPDELAAKITALISKTA